MSTPRTSHRKATNNCSGKASGAIFLSICLCIYFFLATWLHWYQRPEDYRLQSEWIEILTKKGDVLLSDFFDKDSQVCFLPYYSKGEEIALSENDRAYLNRAVEGILGANDVNWWVVVISDDEINKTYRMNQDLVPEEKKTKCLKAESAKLEKKDAFKRDGKYSVSFYINNGEVVKS